MSIGLVCVLFLFGLIALSVIMGVVTVLYLAWLVAENVLKGIKKG